MATFTDNFDRADSTNLGAGWVQVSGTWSIISNRLSSGSAGGTIILRAAGAMATNDHSAQVTIAVTASVSHGVWCRGNANITSGYLWRNDGSSWNLFSVVGGSFTSIGSFAGAAVAGDVAKVQAVGSTIKGFVNGIQRVSVTDTNVPTGTSVGIRAESVSALRFDDFTAADVTTGVTGDAALTVTATLTAGGVRAAAGDASLTPSAGLTADGIRGTSGTAGLATSAPLTAAGQLAAVGDAALTASADLTAAGQRGTGASAELALTADLATSGLRGALAGVALTADADLTAQGQIGHNGDATLTATATLSADGVTGAPPILGAAALAATGTLTAAGQRTAATGATLGATAALAAAGNTARNGIAALAATATLTASGTLLSTHDDVDIAVGAPYSPWTAGEPNAPGWNTRPPQAGDWEVAEPW